MAPDIRQFLNPPLGAALRTKAETPWLSFINFVPFIDKPETLWIGGNEALPQMIV